MKISLRNRLTISYIFVTIVCVFLISILMNVMLEKQFRMYTRQNQQRSNLELAGLISKQYSGGTWNRSVIDNIGVNYIERGMFIKVSDIHNRVIWDATVHNNGLCKKMLDDMWKNMNKYYPHWNGEYKVESYPVYDGKTKIGTVVVGHYGPFYYNNTDLAFIYTLKNRILIFAFIFSLLFTEIFGTIMARMLSRPIARVVRAAENISRGYFKNRIDERSGTKEIYMLTSAINNMAGTLESHEILRKRMSDDIAHELRTPLATLQSHMEAMIDGIWEPDKNRLKSCYEEIIRLASLVGELEMLGKWENENGRLNKIRYDLCEQIEKIVFNFQAEFKNKGVRIKFCGKRQEIFAEKDKISQVIINLISNALKYTPRDGLVTINVENTESMVKMIIKDTGTGISNEDLPFIFDRFYRADKSRNRLTGGKGIGLAIAKTIVELHQGKIDVKSKLNEGSEFIVSLPKV